MALDKQKTSDSLFKNFNKAKNVSNVAVIDKPRERSQDDSIDPAPVENNLQPKWKTLEKVAVLLSVEQRDGIERIAKNIMRNRAKRSINSEKRERITANTIIRALIDTLLEKETLASGLAANAEEEVRDWLKRILKD